MFNSEWLVESRELILHSYQNYRPRADFIRKRKTSNPAVGNPGFNILGYSNIDIPTFQATWNQNSQYKVLDNLFSELYSMTPKHADAVSFITFSTDLGQYSDCPVHLHNFVNQAPCRTTTYGIPLFVSSDLPCFSISTTSKKWPSRNYLDFKSIPKDIEFQRLEIIADSILKIQFNSSYHPHSISNTQSLVAWFVIDGALHNLDFHMEQLPLKKQNRSKIIQLDTP